MSINATSRFARHLVSFAALAVATIGFAGIAGAKTRINVGTVSLGVTDWAHLVADAKGLLKDKDLEINVIATRASSKAVQQLAAGSLDVVSSGLPDHIRAIEKGAPIKIFMNQIGTPPYVIYGKSSIKKITDLKGQKVIVGGPRDITRYYTDALFTRAGLKPGEYDYLYAGSTSNRFAALVAGGVDAAIMYPPLTLRAAAKGYTNLGNIQTVLSDFPFTVYSANTNWLKGHRKALVDYIGTLLKAADWLYDTKNRQEAADILVKATRFKPDDALATYDIFMKEINAVSRDGVISESAYRKMADVLVGWGDLKKPVPPFSKYYDPSYLAAAKKQM